MLTRRFLKSTFPPNHLEALNASTSDEEIGASSPGGLNTYDPVASSLHIYIILYNIVNLKMQLRMNEQTSRVSSYLD